MAPTERRAQLRVMRALEKRYSWCLPGAASEMALSPLVSIARAPSIQEEVGGNGGRRARSTSELDVAGSGLIASS